MSTLLASFRQAARDLVRLASRLFDAVPGLSLIARFWPLVVLVCCAASVVHDARQLPLDTLRFSATGSRLLSDDWLNTFSDSWVQAGVAQLALYGSTSRVERALNLPVHQLASAIIQFCVGFGLVGLVALPHRLTGRRAPGNLLLAAALGCWLLAIPSELYLAGHPAQFGVTALWVLSGAAALRSRAFVAGLLVAFATAFEPWGALGAPLLLLLPGWRLRFTAAAWCALGIAVLWLPFIALGEFSMHEFRWRIRSNSVLAPFLGSPAPFSWQLRLLQGGIALACGAMTARRLRGSAHALWAVPMAVVASRLLLDPVVAPYYWAPVKVLGLVAVASFVALRDERGFGVIPLLYPVLLWGLLPHWAIALSVLAGVALLAHAKPVEIPLARSPAQGTALSSREPDSVPA